MAQTGIKEYREKTCKRSTFPAFLNPIKPLPSSFFPISQRLIAFGLREAAEKAQQAGLEVVMNKY